MGAWIEIYRKGVLMKSQSVAPFMGAWIEMHSCSCPSYMDSVAPFMGAWIEILIGIDHGRCYIESHPLWVRGLK